MSYKNKCDKKDVTIILFSFLEISFIHNLRCFFLKKKRGIVSTARRVTILEAISGQYREN